jgi:hypothetical protein
VVLLGMDEMRARLKDMLLGGEDDIPSFFGGPVNHDAMYPEEGSCPARGEGNLKFDYYGMLERLKKQKAEYMQMKSKQS